jgi:hypothetical protein
MSNLLNIGGQNYFIDFQSAEKLLTSGSTFKGGKVEDKETTETFDSDGKLIGKVVITKETLRGKEVDMFRYETIKDMMDIIFSDDDEEDPAVKVNKKKLDSQPMSFKIAFNTLLEYGVLNIAEDEE